MAHCFTITILAALFHQPAFAFKVFEFSDTRKDDSQVTILNDVESPSNFTLCLDFYSRLDNRRQLLASQDPSDIQIVVEESGYEIHVQIAGVWFLTVPISPGWVDTVTWNTLCVTYNSVDQATVVALRGDIIFTEEKIYPNRKLSSRYLEKFILGRKDKEFHFIGKLTRINIWSKLLSEEALINITDCGSSIIEESPDVLDWKDIKFETTDDVIENDVESYPCNSESNNIHDVLIPVSVKSMAEAVSTCAVLGGKIHFPSSEEDVSVFMDNAITNQEKTNCNDFVWSNYYKNPYADNNWTLYEDLNTYMYPPFKPVGWLEFAMGEPNGREYQNCAAVSLDLNKPHLIYDLPCVKESVCYICRQVYFKCISYEEITFYLWQVRENNLLFSTRCMQQPRRKN